MKKRNGIDIVIPVYNALEDLKICVSSILRHTDLSVDRVVFIDDKSPDENVYDYLKSIEAPELVVLQNERNIGFSATVNRGMQYSDRDVLLLNTDTVVTQRWIDKIVECAYSDPCIGTVTPFSNNATLCSIPNFCENNTVPYGLSIDEYALIIEERSMKKYPRITVAVGFCMFIKNEVIKRVGLFDQETFQKGYGEENDFCWRAEQMGYYHVLCDDTYIYHSGTASFLSKEKKELMTKHEQILLQRYPKQIQKNAEYVRDNPHQYLRSNVDIFAKLKNGKKNILYVLHADFRKDASNNIGGTQFHVKDLMDNLRQDNNVFVLSRDEQILRLTVYLENEHISFKFYVGAKNEFQQFHNKEIAEIYREILNAFSIDIVHVQHIQGLSFDIFDIAKEMKIPLMMTLHDYYYICPTVVLLENGSNFCGGCGENCAQCLKKELGIADQVSYIQFWREKCRQALEACDILITPSDAAKQIYARTYPEVSDRIRVVTHGMDPFATKHVEFRKGSTEGFNYRLDSVFETDYVISGWAYREGKDGADNEVYLIVEDSSGKREQYRTMSINRKDIAEAKSELYQHCSFSVRIPDGCFESGTLKIQILIINGEEEYYSEVIKITGYKKRDKKRRRIAFLGGLSEAKGGSKACQMIQQGGNKYDWYIIGGIGDEKLISLEKSYVHKTGWYRREDVKQILNQNLIDIVCILPIWAETFCYTVSETELSGIPVLGTDIGAVGERLRSEQTGWIVAKDASAKDILATIENIFNDRAGFDEMLDKVRSYKHKSISEMCIEYAEIYRTFAISEKRAGDYDKEAIYSAYTMGQKDAVGYGNVSNAELIRRVSELEASMMEVNQSLGYKIFKHFSRKNFPFKKQIKKLFGFMYKQYKKVFRQRKTKS